MRAVLPGGHDNRTFRLGDDLAVRLPSAAAYAPAVAKEQRWLPVLAPRLPVPIPVPVAAGAPTERFPLPWSVNRWLPGRTALDGIPQPERLALDLAAFLAALRAAPAADGPAAGPHSFFRGGDLSVYADEARAAIAARGSGSDARWARAVLDRALDSAWQGGPVWVHGDVAPGNLLLRDGGLAGVIDFGCCAVGDPACDLVPRWTVLPAAAAARFTAAIGLDYDTWARAAGWALWKAVITPGDPASADVLARLRDDPVPGLLRH